MYSNTAFCSTILLIHCRNDKYTDIVYLLGNKKLANSQRFDVNMPVARWYLSDRNCALCAVTKCFLDILDSFNHSDLLPFRSSISLVPRQLPKVNIAHD